MCVYMCVCMCVCVCVFQGPLPLAPSPCTGCPSTVDPSGSASQVTSALQPLNPAVHYLTSTGGKDTFTTVSWLLMGFPRLMTVANVSVMLDDMVNRVYEVVSIQVQGEPALWGHCQADSEARAAPVKAAYTLTWEMAGSDVLLCRVWAWLDSSSAHSGPIQV